MTQPAIETAPASVRSDRESLLARSRAAAARAWAGFWLQMFMFWNLRRPEFARSCKPFFVFMAWRTSRLLRDNLRANARWLLKPNSSQRERAALGKRVLGNFYDFIVDLGRSKKMSVEQLLKEISHLEGRERYFEARSLKRGAILVTAHLGSFETGVAALVQQEREIHVVFRRDLMPQFERLRFAQRAKLGLIEAPVDDGLGVWVRLRDALHRDAVVLMQGDRVMPGQKGQRVPFLGGHIMAPTGPVKLAMATGAPIIPVFAPREQDGRVRIILEEPIFVGVDAGAAHVHAALTQLTNVIEKYVREYSDQWLAVHRAWCEDAEATP